MNSTTLQKPRLIGLYSTVPQCGKTTCAQFLAHSTGYGYAHIPQAGAIKHLTVEFLTEVGLTYHQALNFVNHDKETIIAELGVSSRHIQQTLGTEWGRDCISPNVWLNMWKTKVKTSLQSGISVVCDDIRFPNEVEALKELGGVLICIHRPDAPVPTGEHRSDSYALQSDYIIVNRSTKEDLIKGLVTALTVTYDLR